MAKMTRREMLGGAAALGVGATLARSNAQAATHNDVAQLYESSDALDLAEHVRRKQVTPKELLEEATRRLELVNPKLNAVTLRHDDQARQLLKDLPNGPFSGVPFLLKDLGANLGGTVTTGGSRSLQGIKAKSDNEIVSRYRQAGFVPFGKTNVPEFGMALTTESTLYGPCRNPWNTEHSTGGSSGGSAAAVAAGIVPVAHGTDGGGSIRVPAAACGVFGFKPTRLLTPRGPGSALGPAAMSVGHVLSRTVRDSALALNVTAGPETSAPFAAPGVQASNYYDATQRDPSQLRVLVNWTEPTVDLDDECRSTLTKTAKILEGLGHVVEEGRLGVDYDSINEAQSKLVLAQFSQGMLSLAKNLGKSVDHIGLEPLSLHFVKVGERITATDYIKCCQHSYQACGVMAKLLTRYDLVLQPVTATPPPRIGVINYQPSDDHESFVNRFRQYAAFTYLYNLTGQPSASVPAGFTKAGLPLAVMLSGKNGDDATVLAACAQLERANPWFNQRPN